MIATGVQWRRLEAPGIDRLQGAGIYYGGGVTEALSCKGETVYVVGGANSAGQAAMNFARYAERVVILVRGESLSSTMSRYLIEQIQETPNIQLWRHASVAEAHGETHLEEISVLCSDSNRVERVPTNAMFIFIGALPRTDWLAEHRRTRRARLPVDRPRSNPGRPAPKGMGARPRSVSTRDQCPRDLCRGRCPPRFYQTSCFRSWRRLGGSAIHSSVLEQSVMVDESELLRIPAFADLPDDQIAWFLSQSQELHVKAGDAYALQGRPADSMFVILEGQFQWRGDLGGETIGVFKSPG